MVTHALFSQFAPVTYSSKTQPICQMTTFLTSDCYVVITILGCKAFYGMHFLIKAFHAFIVYCRARYSSPLPSRAYSFPCIKSQAQRATLPFHPDL